MPATDATHKLEAGAYPNGPNETNSLRNILRAIADISDIELAAMAETNTPPPAQ